MPARLSSDLGGRLRNSPGRAPLGTRRGPPLVARTSVIIVGRSSRAATSGDGCRPGWPRL